MTLATPGGRIIGDHMLIKIGFNLIETKRKEDKENKQTILQNDQQRHRDSNTNLA